MVKIFIQGVISLTIVLLLLARSLMRDAGSSTDTANSTVINYK